MSVETKEEKEYLEELERLGKEEIEKAQPESQSQTTTPSTQTTTIPTPPKPNPQKQTVKPQKHIKSLDQFIEEKANEIYSRGVEKAEAAKQKFIDDTYAKILGLVPTEQQPALPQQPPQQIPQNPISPVNPKTAKLPRTYNKRTVIMATVLFTFTGVMLALIINLMH